MKATLFLFIISVVSFITSCGNKSEHDKHDHGDNLTTANPNDALYDEVMKIHDEVMPKMDDIYKLKQDLKKQIADSPNLVDEKRKEIELKIASLETASENMMQWMREFNPPADSLGEEVQREYLEEQLESVKKVRESVLSAVDSK